MQIVNCQDEFRGTRWRDREFGNAGMWPFFKGRVCQSPACPMSPVLRLGGGCVHRYCDHVYTVDETTDAYLEASTLKTCLAVKCPW
jgi:hypothetical protein